MPATPPNPTPILTRRDRAPAAIIANWRALTSPNPSARRRGPGARTLLACSAGADSSALVLTLAEATDDLVVAHIRHDLRPEHETAADRDAAAALAARLGLAFVQASVSVRTPPDQGTGPAPANLESRARHLRYHALTRLARESGCPFVATGHHADDQLETMLMALLRGAGPRGLAGMPVRRRLAGADGPGPIRLIRPMLGDGTPGGGGGRTRAPTHADCEAICRSAGWVWREDGTNRDRSLLRNTLRAEVLPILERLRPGTAVRAAGAAALLREADSLVRARAGSRLSQGQADGITTTWPRALLRAEPTIVVGELLRATLARAGPAGADRLTRAALAPAARAIRDLCTDPREFRLGAATVLVTAQRVTISPFRT